MSELHTEALDDLNAAVSRLSRDLAIAARTMSANEARFLVDAYYTMQKDRIRAAHQERTCHEAGEPASVLSWLGNQSSILEQQLKRALDNYSAHHPAGVWARSQLGVGPVIAAGLLASIDIEKAVTVGHIWRFAGLDPTMVWNKGEKRPWNASLKRLCWLLGESFVKVAGKDSAFYGQVYKERKEYEQKRNIAGENADAALLMLTKKKIGKDTDAYKWYSGTWVFEKALNPGHSEDAQDVAPMLPPAQIHERAKRYAVKLFLAHLHQIWREVEGLPVPKPYAISILGHAHEIKPPSQNH